MTLQVAVLVEGDASGAKSATDLAAAGLREVGQASQQASSGANQLASASRVAEGALQGEAAATRVSTAALQSNAAAARLASMQRANLIFQLNDIGVSLASGMNPLMVAIQQGSQISTIYGPGGLGKAFAETGKLAVGMVTKFWPVAVAVGVVTAAVASMTTEINRGQKVQVSATDVMTAMWELAAERIMKVMKPVFEWLGNVWNTISPYIAIGVEWIIDAFDFAFTDISFIWAQLPQVLGDIVVTTANAVIGGIEWMVNGAIALINGLISGANAGLGVIGLELQSLGNVTFGRLDNPYEGTVGGILEELMKRRDEILNTSALGAIGDRAREVHLRPDGDEKTGTKKESEYSRDIAQIRERTAALEMERRAIGLSTFEAEKMRKVFELENAARKDAIGLTPARVVEIEREATAYATAKAALEVLQEAYDTAKEIWSSFWSDLRQAQESGIKGWAAWADAGAKALDRMRDKALEAASDAAFNWLWGAVMGAIFPGSTGIGLGIETPNILSSTGNLIPGNAAGTDNWRGGLTQINERGGEIIDLPSGSRIYPHDVSMAMAQSGGSVQIIDQRSAGAPPIERSSYRNSRGEQMVRLIVRDEMTEGYRRGRFG